MVAVVTRESVATVMESRGIGCRLGDAKATSYQRMKSRRYAVLTGDSSNGYLTVYDATLASTVDLAWPFPLPTAPHSGNPYSLVDVNEFHVWTKNAYLSYTFQL